MSRALLAFALAFSLGNPAAVGSWAEALVQLALPMAGEAGGQWDPNGAGSQSNAGSQWDPNGTESESDAGSKWDPNG
jgi:hypothetical protein